MHLVFQHAYTSPGGCQASFQRRPCFAKPSAAPTRWSVHSPKPGFATQGKAEDAKTQSLLMVTFGLLGVPSAPSASSASRPLLLLLGGREYSAWLRRAGLFRIGCGRRGVGFPPSALRPRVPTKWAGGIGQGGLRLSNPACIGGFGQGSHSFSRERRGWWRDKRRWQGRTDS